MNRALKPLARIFKILAIVDYIVAPLILRPHWGINRVADAQLIGLAVLSLIPNRWFVGTRVLFGTALLLSLLPYPWLLSVSTFSDLDVASTIAACIGVFLIIIPLPLSLVLSRTRALRKDRFVFA